MHPEDSIKQLRNIIYKELIKTNIPKRNKLQILELAKKMIEYVEEDQDLKLVVTNNKEKKNATRKKEN